MAEQAQLNEEQLKNLQTAIIETRSQASATSTSIDQLLANLKGIGITQYSADALRMELRNPNSIISQYFNAMVNDEVIKEEQQRFTTLLTQIYEKVKALLTAEYMEEKKESAAEGDSQFAEEQRQLQERQAQVQITPLTQTVNLAANKSKELNHWLSVFGKDPAFMDQAINSINRRYQQIEKNLNQFNNLLSDPNLSQVQKKDIAEYYGVYHRHLELSSLENKQKYIPQYMSKDPNKIAPEIKDPKLQEKAVLQQGLQVVRKDGMHEEMMGRFLDAKAGKPMLRTDTNLQAARQAARPYLDLHQKLDRPVTKFLEQDPKNLDEIFNDKNKKASFDSVMDLVDSLQKLKSNPQDAALHETYTKVEKAIKDLAGKKEYAEISQTLQTWQSQNPKVAPSPTPAATPSQMPRPAFKPSSAPTPKPNWTAETQTHNITHQGGTIKDKNEYLAKLKQVFGNKSQHIYETKNGFKYTYNGREIHFDTTTNEITLKNLDKETFMKIAEVISATGPKDGSNSMDISRVPEKYHHLAVDAAKAHNVGLVGVSDKLKSEVGETETVRSTI